MSWHQTPESPTRLQQLNLDIAQACRDIRAARHESEENEARVRFDRLIVERHDLQTLGRPKAWLAAFLWEASRDWKVRVEVGAAHPCDATRKLIVHTSTWPRVVECDEKGLVFAKCEPEAFLRSLMERIGPML